MRAPPKRPAATGPTPKPRRIRVRRERNPQIRNIPAIEAKELRRHDADHGESLAGQSHIGAQGCRISAELPAPKRVADYRHAIRRASPVVVRADGASHECLDSQRRKEGAGNFVRPGAFRYAAGLQHHARRANREHVREHAVVPAKILEDRVGEIRHHAPSGAALTNSTSSCGFFTGKARSSMTSMRLKRAVLAPMPRASESTATVLNTGVFASVRAA